MFLENVLIDRRGILGLHVDIELVRPRDRQHVRRITPFVDRSLRLNDRLSGDECELSRYLDVGFGIEPIKTSHAFKRDV